MHEDRPDTRPATRPLLLTGFGLGAFLDGIVLHQVLQWHHLVSDFRAPDDLAGLRANTFWDGVFHFASWLIVLGGLLWVTLVMEVPTWLRWVGCIAVSAVFFSLAHTGIVNHHAGAEAFRWAAFGERTAAGVLYGYVFVRQGLAVSTLAHLGYLVALEAGLGRWL